MSRVLMRVMVVEDNEGTITVRLGVADEHTAHCPNCMAMFALRLSNAFLGAIEEMRQDASEDNADEQPGHALH